MKKIQLIILAALLLAGCNYKKPIADVLAQTAAATTNSIVEISSKQAMIEAMDSPAGKDALIHHRDHFLDEDKFVPALEKISVSGCPRDFKTAWGHYLSAWEKVGHQRSDRLIEVGTAVVNGGGVSWFPVLADVLHNDFSDVSAAQAELKKAAAAHGVN